MGKRIVLFLVGLLVLPVVAGLWLRSNGAGSSEEATSADAPLPAPVIRFSGEVKAKRYARLGFESTGIARTVAVAVGDTVVEDQELVVLDRELQEATVANAYANRVSARDSALVALEAARSALTMTEAENKQTIEKARQAVLDTKQELDDAKDVFSRTADESGDESAAAATKKMAITTAEKAYNAAQESLTEARATQAKEDAAAAEALRVAEAAYAATTQASLVEPGVAALAALETSARVQLARKVLTAPFAGTVTKIDIESNEVAIGGQPVVTIQSLDELEIEGRASESDVTELAEGQEARVTFDAFGDDREWVAKITRIDPAGEKVDGISRYTVYLDVQDTERRLRPGFTANVFVGDFDGG